MQTEKWYLLKLFQEWGKDKGEWWRGWIQMWYIWYIVRTFVNATMYPQHNNKKGKGKVHGVLSRESRLLEIKARTWGLNQKHHEWSSVSRIYNCQKHLNPLIVSYCSDPMKANRVKVLCWSQERLHQKGKGLLTPWNDEKTTMAVGIIKKKYQEKHGYLEFVTS
jgi:hypothetical protein